MVFRRTVEGSVTSKVKAKLAVYSCPFDVTTTETKGTVLIKTADELANFSRGEESKMEDDVSIGNLSADLVFYISKFSVREHNL